MVSLYLVRGFTLSQCSIFFKGTALRLNGNCSTVTHNKSGHWNLVGCELSQSRWMYCNCSWKLNIKTSADKDVALNLITIIWFMVVVHPLLHGHILTINQFLCNKRSRDLRLRCNCEACMDSLAGQTAILKVEKCLSSLTAACQALSKMLAQRDLCNIIRFQDAKLTLTFSSNPFKAYRLQWLHWIISMRP